MSITDVDNKIHGIETCEIRMRDRKDGNGVKNNKDGKVCVESVLAVRL